MNAAEKQTESLLFESIGSNEKRKKSLQGASYLVIGCGVVLLLLGVMESSMRSMPELAAFCMLFGVGAILLGARMSWWLENKDYGDQYELRIYSDHVEGVQAQPLREFSVPWKEVLDVRQTTLMSNDMILLETERGTYTLLVKDQETAYRILSQKLDEEEKL